MMKLRCLRATVLLPRGPMRAMIVAVILALVAASALLAQESEKIAHARRLAHVALSGGIYETMIDQAVSLAVKSTLGAIEKEVKRELTPSEHDVLVSALRDTFYEVLPIGVWEDALAPIYAKYLTVSDMTEMLTFYETDLGQKLVSLQSRVILDGMQTGESLAKTHEREFRDRLQQRLQEILRASPLGADSASGNQSFGPEIQFDTKGVEFGLWIRPFIVQVKRNWFIPEAAMSMKGHVVITFNVQKNGTITDVDVRTPSTVGTFNNAARDAIIASNPVPPLPPEYPDEKAFFTVTFYYNESPPPNPSASPSARGSLPDGTDRPLGSAPSMTTPTPASGVGTSNLSPGVFRPGNGVTLPRLVKEVKPQYTSDAMHAKIQGTVLVECVVNTDGSVGNVKVVRSLDRTYGLDEEAIKAAEQWRFAPGTRNGEPVPVLVSIELTFTLGK